MADYYPLIARAIAGLDPSAPGESRRALYERARSALIAQRVPVASVHSTCGRIIVPVCRSYTSMNHVRFSREFVKPTFGIQRLAALVVHDD